MNKSEKINEIAAALAAFNLESPTIKLNKTVNVQHKNGGQHAFKYADFSEIVSKTRPVLAKHGLSVLQFLTDNYAVKTVIVHKSGQYIAETFTPNLPATNDPKRVGANATYFKRYAYAAALGIVADDDNENTLQPIQNAGKGTPTFQQPDPERIKLIATVKKGVADCNDTEELQKYWQENVESWKTDGQIKRIFHGRKTELSANESLDKNAESNE